MRWICVCVDGFVCGLGWFCVRAWFCRWQDGPWDGSLGVKRVLCVFGMLKSEDQEGMKIRDSLGVVTGMVLCE